MKRLTTRLSVMALVLLATAQGRAELPKANPADESALNELSRAFRAAFNKGDAEAIAACSAFDGDRVGPGGQMSKGRGEIQKAYADFFAHNKGATLNASFDSLRFITPEVAISDGYAEVTPAPEDGPSKVHGTVVLVKRNGKWLMAAVRLMVPFQQPKR
jgi:uncharacterized protein (TIGR02246 family)